MKRILLPVLGAAGLSLVALAGCKSEEQASAEPREQTPRAQVPHEPMPREQMPRERAAPPGAAGEEASDRPAPAGEPVVLTVIGVDVEPRLAEVCGVPRNKLFFEFDSAKLSGGAKEILGQVADCAKTGAAKGKELQVIGRADPRGPDEYNKKLGMSRAESVAEYLKKQGVSTARVETESKGEQGAAESPLGWPGDRRVTIRLKE